MLLTERDAQPEPAVGVAVGISQPAALLILPRPGWLCVAWPEYPKLTALAAPPSLAQSQG